jgi:hypothetical protein
MEQVTQMAMELANMIKRGDITDSGHFEVINENGLIKQ